MCRCVYVCVFITLNSNNLIKLISQWLNISGVLVSTLFVSFSYKRRGQAVLKAVHENIDFIKGRFFVIFPLKQELQVNLFSGFNSLLAIHGLSVIKCYFHSSMVPYGFITSWLIPVIVQIMVVVASFERNFKFTK